MTYHLLSYGYFKDAEQFGAHIPIGWKDSVEVYTVNHLQPDTAFYFKIRGGNGCRTGDWSKIMKVKTEKKSSSGGIIFYEYSKITTKLLRFISNP